MVNPVLGLNSRLEDALTEVDDFFQSKPELQASRLSELEITTYYKEQKIVTGWRLYNTVPPYEYHVLVDENFPFSAPRIAIGDRFRIPVVPHIDKKTGILCLLRSTDTVSSFRPANQVATLLTEAAFLIQKGTSGENTSDFIDEFVSYWESEDTHASTRVFSLVEPLPTSRVIVMAQLSNGDFIFGENKKMLTDWISNASVIETGIDEAGFIWLSRLPIPSEYPKTSAKLFSYIAANSTDGKKILRDLAKNKPRSIRLLIGGQSNNGRVLFAAALLRPKASVLDKGFRRGNTSPELIATRYLNANDPISTYTVHRVDHAWIHGRDSLPETAKIETKKVIMIGCGSLGSLIAKNLAMCGIGHLCLIDHENLATSNTGRHLLGINKFGKSKAESLARQLRTEYPHIQIDCYKGKWHKALQDQPDLLSESSLIVSTTGSWEAESMLNDLAVRSGLKVPIIYGWVEPFAVAGQAVFILPSDGCLQCGRDEMGTPNLRVAQWVEGLVTTKNEPACGISFQPYGPIELQHVATLVSETIMSALLGEFTRSTHRLWASSDKRLIENNGKWSPEWLNLSPTGGNVIKETPWEMNDKCQVCIKTEKNK